MTLLPSGDQTPITPDIVRCGRLGDPAKALGLAVAHLMTRPSFARLPFGSWSRVLAGQVNRGHYLMAFRGQGLAGFVGWAMTSREVADAWLSAGRDFSFAEASGGPCVVVNAWSSTGDEVARALRQALRREWAGAQAIVFRRFYEDGRVRPVRLARPLR